MNVPDSRVVVKTLVRSPTAADLAVRDRRLVIGQVWLPADAAAVAAGARASTVWMVSPAAARR